MGRRDEAEVSGQQDPEGEDPWVMQLVVRVEKSSPPTRTAALEASATTVCRLLADSRRHADPDWEARFDRWAAGRIRKHVRRARGAKWQAVQDLPGLTAVRADAEVRALVPTPAGEVHPQVAALQMSGRDLADPGQVAQADPPPGVLVVAVSAEPELEWGKAAAAAAHAAQVAWMDAPQAFHDQWAAAGFPVAVEHPGVARWRRLREQAPVRIRDAGFTGVAAGTVTAVARWYGTSAG